MAATKNFYAKKLMLLFNEGELDGEIVLKRKTISNIDELANADGLYNTAQAIASLQELPLVDIYVDEDYIVQDNSVV